MTDDIVTDDPILAYLQRVHSDTAQLRDGELATYIPELAKADPSWFGICVATADGAVYEVGDTRQQFTIQSISKAFTYALMLDELGAARVEERIGVEPTGEAFNSISLDPVTGKPLNPMINAGAITAAGLVVEHHDATATSHLLAGYGRFADRALKVDDTVFESERETAHRNRAIAHLLVGSGVLRVDPELALDVYLRGCSVLVDAHDLAIMAATLANGGVNPMTRERAASAATVTRVLTVMATCGMYDGAGQWLYSIGLPAKSGVAGGLICVLPGRLAISVFSPLLDVHGNSVRGVAVSQRLSNDLHLHLATSPADAAPPVRSVSDLRRLRSKRIRREAALDVLERRGAEAMALQLQGELDFAAVEMALRRIATAPVAPRFAVLDLRRVVDVTDSAVGFFSDLATMLLRRDGRLIVTGANRFPEMAALSSEALQVDDFDLALEWCEEQLLQGSAEEAAESAVDLADHEALVGLSAGQLHTLNGLMERRTFATGALIQQQGQRWEGLLLITTGRISMFVGQEGANRRRVATLAAGMLLGELAIANGSAAADALADTDVECQVLPAQAVAALRESDPELWATLMTNVLQVAARRVDRLRALLAAAD